MTSEEDKVLVTGASGFIACHIVQQLLRSGHMVRGTVRSLKNEQKVLPLRQLCPDAKHPLELVEADLTDAECWTEAIKGCTYVIHVASPFPSQNPKCEDEVIKPAVDGTLNVLKAAHATGGIKRVVITSSEAAVSSGHNNLAGRVFTEADWSNMENPKMSAYLKSKTLAEKAAWDFVKGLTDGEKLDIAVINPGFVMGPVLCGSFSTSMELPCRLLKRDMPMLPRVAVGLCDVRDVATAHINAMTVPGAVGHRHIINTDTVWFEQCAQIISKEFRKQGYKVPTAVAPNFLIRFVGLFDPTIKMIVPTLGERQEYDNSRMRNVLGVTPRPVNESLLDMCYSLIENGFVPKTRLYKGKI